MPLYEKKAEGGYMIRTPYIGFIKNNWLRRISMMLAAPVMFCLVMTINIVQVTVWLMQSVLRNLKGIYTCQVRFWNRPRTKDEPT